MAGHRRGSDYQTKKWQRFTQRYGMFPSEWRTLKKSNPTEAHQIRMRVDQARNKSTPIGRNRNI